MTFKMLKKVIPINNIFNTNVSALHKSKKDFPKTLYFEN